MTLLVAILSLTIAAAPVLKNATEPKESQLSAVLQSSSEKYLTALVSNTGGRAGSIKGATIKIPVQKWLWTIPLAVKTADQGGAALALPNSSLLVRFKVTRGAFNDDYNHLGGGGGPINASIITEEEPGGVSKSTNCYVVYDFSNFDGSPKSTTQHVRCDSFDHFIEANAGKLDGDQPISRPPTAAPGN
jgi:hypothetical protein